MGQDTPDQYEIDDVDLNPEGKSMSPVRTLLFLIAVLSVSYFLSGQDILQEFMPRSYCMFNNKRLIALHLISDTGIFISYTGIGVILYKVYRALSRKHLPFTDFFWQFGGFIFFCGLTHLVSIINIFITFYWLDGLVKLMTCWFSFLVFIHLVRDFKKIMNVPTPPEINKLAYSLNEILTTIKSKN